MLQLKDYQQRSLRALQQYFRLCADEGDADTAFYRATKESMGRGIPYQPVGELPGLPYVCLRIPTGGGKTLMACHAVGTATEDLLQADRSVVLWLVPSNAILEQTLRALKDRQHPYRQAVEAEVGAVQVMNIEEALYVSRATLDTATTIIVSTMQAFRVQDTGGRKVYEDAGALMDHFSDLPAEAKAGLERFEDGTPKRSLANVLRVRRPVVIVDEAHNARTKLSFETLARFDPACVIEFTATPDREEHPSNILHSVSAAELKAEEMIKLPIQLTTQQPWKELMGAAIEQRDFLEQEAREEERETGEYLRPVMLIKAEANRGADSLTVDVVAKALQDDHRIPEEQIAIATGASDDLEGANILSPDSPLRYVITIQKLQEGWNCPFAYVLCSVAAMRSNQAVEQIVGRILRMPQAKRKRRDALNMAYAFAADEDFGAALNAVRDVLIENGFERQEAETLVKEAAGKRAQRGSSHGPLFDQEQPEPKVTVEITFDEAPDLEKLPRETAKKVRVDGAKGTLTYRGTMDEAERDALKSCFTAAEGQDAVEEAYHQAQIKSGVKVKAPAERGESFEVPQLAIERGGQVEAFEQTHLLNIDWKLSDHEATLPSYNAHQRRGQRGAIDVDEGRVKVEFLDALQRQLTLLTDDRGWTVPALVRWLDRAIPHPDITPQDATAFLARLLQEHLLGERGFTIDQLVRGKYRLRRAIEARINEHRQAARRQAHQRLLKLDDSPITVRPDVCFSFGENYPYSPPPYDGSYGFRKHYYPQVGRFDSGEEEECAGFIDRLPEIGCWVRNLDRRPRHAFWLQTATDRFYPDFVCKTRDKRYLVVEYKGADRWSNDDSTEKRNLGQVWEERSEGRCLFVMPKGRDFGTIRAKVSG